MKTCFVTDCKSGYRSVVLKNKAKGLPNPSVFSAPLDPELFQKWKKAIPRRDREFTPDDYVCQKHFEPSMIARVYSISDPDDKTGRLKLKPGSIPTVFPNCPKYLCPKVRTRKPPAVRHPLPKKESKVCLIQSENDRSKLSFKNNRSVSSEKGRLTLGEFYSQCVLLLSDDFSCTLWNRRIIIQKWTEQLHCQYKVFILENRKLKIFIHNDSSIVLDNYNDKIIDDPQTLLDVFSEIENIRLCHYLSEFKKDCRGYLRPDETFCAGCNRVNNRSVVAKNCPKGKIMTPNKVLHEKTPGGTSNLTKEPIMISSRSKSRIFVIIPS